MRRLVSHAFASAGRNGGAVAAHVATGAAQQRWCSKPAAAAAAAPSLSSVRHMTFGHSMTIPVRWGDMDAYGHVNNTTYLVYMESSRVDMFDNMYREAGLGDGMPAKPDECAPIVGEISIKYISTTTFPDEVVCESCVTHMQENSLYICTRGTSKRTGSPAFVSTCKVVFLDYRTNKRAPPPEALRKVIAGYVCEV